MMNRIVILLLSIFLFQGCMTFRSTSVTADFRKTNGNISIYEISSDIDGQKNLILEEQVRVIAQSHIDQIAADIIGSYSLKIKLYEKSYFLDSDFIHSLFISFSLYDRESNPIAVVSEYSTGNYSFMSPDIQDKLIKKCIEKIKTLEL